MSACIMIKTQKNQQIRRTFNMTIKQENMDRELAIQLDAESIVKEEDRAYFLSELEAESVK